MSTKTSANNKDAIILEQNGEWLTVWFNRPKVRNALVKDLFDQLMQVLDLLKDKQSFRGIIFRGTEGFFCAGGDLKSFKAMGSAGAEAKSMSLQTSHDIAELLKKIRALPQLTVAVVEGAAMAGGFGIACATDIMLVMADAKFALTETRIGLPAAQIAPYVVERIGPAQARKLMLLASSIDGEQAHQIGLADFVAKSELELEVLTDYIKSQLQDCGPQAVAATKKILAANQEMNLDDYIPYAAEVFTECLLSDEGQEGFSSFIEKRQPVWAVVDEEE